MNDDEKYQVLNPDDLPAACNGCGGKLDAETKAYQKVEVNRSRACYGKFKCTKCRAVVWVEWALFNQCGHIKGYVFMEPEDGTCSWQSALTSDQTRTIARHLDECRVCRDRRDKVLLQQIWYRTLIKSENQTNEGGNYGKREDKKA
jgi:hypothetical protein